MNKANEAAIKKVRDWLDTEGKSIQDLAEEVGISKSLMGHILTGKRQFLPNRMAQVAKVIGVTVEELLAEDRSEKPYVLSLHGKANSRATKRQLENMLFAIEDCLRIEEINRAAGEKPHE
ncbi:helix-turn-helix transcriptional regulator [Weizmannia sp. FSL W8-1119]|uniref:helix-turn-helix domain-containing protein n=1 Tax=Weizmannia sp. FSL W8-1119 TaxID=2954709 RepID=UPI0030F597F4